MRGRARKSFIPSVDDFRGGAPVAARSAATRRVSRYGAMRLAWSLLLVSAAASAAADSGYEDFYWSLHGCKDAEFTKDYLERVEAGEFSGRYSKEARQCLRRWEDEERVAWERLKDCTDIDAVKKFEREHPDSPYAAEASECIDKYERHERIERQLDGCRGHFDAGRISTGLPGNALECYGKVLQDDPGNPDAMRGIDDIVSHYSGKAEDALDRGDSDAAERAIEQVAKITPESSNLEALRRKLEELRHEIAAHERIEQERKNLHTEAERLFEENKFEEVVTLVEDASKRGVEDKRASTLARQAREALAAAEAERLLEAKVDEVRTRIGQKDAAGARKSLLEAKDLGLNPETHGRLAAAIEDVERENDEAVRRQEREAIVSESQAARERGDYEGARDAMRRARDLELPEERYREEMERIDRLEAAQRLATCLEHKSGRRWQEALTCVRQVLELGPDNAEARDQERELEMLVAFSSVHQSPTVEGWFKFIGDYPWSPLVDAAKIGLKELEPSYWEEVKAVDTPEAYRQYLEIYPTGPNASEARRRSGGG